MHYLNFAASNYHLSRRTRRITQFIHSASALLSFHTNKHLVLFWGLSVRIWTAHPVREPSVPSLLRSLFGLFRTPAEQVL